MGYGNRTLKGEIMNLQILPLAITMNAGPQIMSAIIFVTAAKPLKLSAAFLAGVVIAVTAGVTITFTLATLPVLSYMVFHRRAQRLMPKVSDWMNANSWLVNIVVYVIFIFLIFG
jgi:hypothetical protein